MCDYNNAYIFVKGAINILAATINEIDKVQNETVFKNNAPFRSCQSKISNLVMGNAYFHADA